MSSSEKSIGVAHTEHRGDVDVLKTVHADGEVDYVDTHALGGELDQMPAGYFYSYQFIGTVIVSLFTTSSEYH